LFADFSQQQKQSDIHVQSVIDHSQLLQCS